MTGMIKFPSIGHLKNLAAEVPYARLPQGTDTGSVEYTGTVKLHGTHCDLVSAAPSAPLCVQSRNRMLTTDADNCGSAKFAAERTAAIDAIVGAIRQTCGGVHVVLAGEICGKGVQKGVGISGQAEKFFVILNVKVDGAWQPADAWQHVGAAPDRIFNIRHFPRYTVTVDLSDTMASLDEVQRLTADVGAACPVALTLGTPGKGEGIVWVPRQVALASQSRLWFKSKAEEHTVTPAVDKPVSGSSLGSSLAAAEFVDGNLTDARLQQGLDYLREFDKPATMQHLGDFLKWVTGDVLKECGQELDADTMKASRKLIAARGRKWYMTVSA